MTPLFASIIQLVFMISVAPFVLGFVRLCKARLQGRRGASPWLMYVSLATLMKKQEVISESRSWVFRCVPAIVLITTFCLCAILPLMFSFVAVGGVDDVFVLSGLLALGAIFLVLGGIDSASAFGGMGASREMTLAALIEPVFITAMTAFAVEAQNSHVGIIMTRTDFLTHPALLLSLLAFVCVALAENARYPVDNPATHLELTMVHEAVILEYSGPSLALLELASAMKLTLFLLLSASFLFPPLSAVGISAVALAVVFALLKILAAAALLALLESSIAKMRFYRMQEYLTSAFFLALTGLVLTILV